MGYNSPRYVLAVVLGGEPAAQGLPPSEVWLAHLQNRHVIALLFSWGAARTSCHACSPGTGQPVGHSEPSSTSSTPELLCVPVSGASCMDGPKE